MAVLLLDLPLDVLHIILFHSALIRRTRRALRLRLVCKTFDAALPAAVFETRLLDDYLGIGSMTWHLEAQHADRMWHKYLVMRTMGETDPAVGRFCEVRQVAQLARQEMMRSDGAPVPALRELVEDLCWLLLRQTVQCAAWDSWGPMGPKMPFRRDVALLPLSLLSVAAYLNLPALAQRLLDEGHNPHNHTFLFAPAMQTAAQAGHGAMLVLLRRQGYRNGLTMLEAGRCLGERINWAIAGATIRGDPDFLREVLACEDPSGLIPPLDCKILARTRDVYKCLGSAVVPAADTPCRDSTLEDHARQGHLDIVEYLLDLGFPPTNADYRDRTPLVSACAGGHWDVAKLLLARGAAPNQPSMHFTIYRYAIHAPAVANSVSAARLLLDHGADPNIGVTSRTRTAWPYPAIWHAFERENTALVRLLMERGAQVNESLRLCIAEVLHHLEYESMEEEFHRLFSFQLEPGTPYPVGRRKWRGWHRWRDALEKRERVLDQYVVKQEPDE